MAQISAGARAFLSGIIDYAGIFPPASLPLEKAVENFAAYLESSERWMLARFVVPARLLPEVTRHSGLLPKTSTMQIAALGRGSEDWAGFFENMEADLEEIESFRRSHGDRVRVDVYETTLPPSELDYQIRADALVAQAAARLDHAGLRPYFEVPFPDRWKPRAARAIAAAAKNPPAGFKLRTGGTEPEAIPPVPLVAWTIRTCLSADVPFKCTAGLHHPVRGLDPDLGVESHGFLNVFGGAVLADVHALDEEAIAEILNDTDPGNFIFSDQALRWKHLEAPADRIQKFRESALPSFGSCSFDEPIEDLRKREILPP